MEHVMQLLLTLGAVIFCMWYGYAGARSFLYWTGLESFERLFQRWLCQFLCGKKRSTQAIICFCLLYICSYVIQYGLSSNPVVSTFIFRGQHPATAFILLLMLVAGACLIGFYTFTIIEAFQGIRTIIKRGHSHS